MNTSLRKRFFTWLMKKREPANHRMYGTYKEDLFCTITGTVVEIGPGMGSNFRYFPTDIEWIGIEINDAFTDALLAAAHARNITASLRHGDAASIPLSDNSADIVLCTLVLCSVLNPSAAVAEMKRILKPGGKLIFIEHVAGRHKTVMRTVQNIINPVNRFLFDGCNCNRETWTYFENGGFTQLELSHRSVKGSFTIHTPHIMGIAVK